MTEEDSDSQKSQFSEQSALFDHSKQSKVRERLKNLKERNEANRKIRSFINLLRRKDTGK